MPVTIWLVSPYPNHIRDVANLVINRPLGESTVGAGAAIYLDALRTTYFYREWVLTAVVAAFVVAAARYRRQPPVMQWIILAIPLQSAAIALHQTRFPRFLLLTVVLLCLAAAAEAGRWLGTSRAGRVAAGLLALVTVGAGVSAARSAVTQERFRLIAFENYTDNDALRGALDSIQGGSPPTIAWRLSARVMICPPLFRWGIGTAIRRALFAFRDRGSAGHGPRARDPGAADGAARRRSVSLDETSAYLAQRRSVMDAIGRGELMLRREIPLPDMNVSLRLYDRTSRPTAEAACR